MEVEAEVEVPMVADLSDVLQAVRNKSISQEALVSVLVDNVDTENLLIILIEEFGLKHAKRLMMKTLRIAKKQARERRLNEIRTN